MEIRPIIDHDFSHVDTAATVGTLRGAFQDPTVKAIPLIENGDVLGIITQRDVISSHELPGRKVQTLARSVPRPTPDTDVREVARLMLTADSEVLPVIERDELVGVVTTDALLEHVQEHLGALGTSDIMTADIVSVRPDASLGEVLATFREHGIRHIPVTGADGACVGIVSLHDVLEFVTRSIERSQGGRPAEHMDAASGEDHGGFGAREGERAKLLSIPVRDVMIDPVVSSEPDVTVDELVELMQTNNVSSVVVQEHDEPVGIATKTDVLESLTWEDTEPYYIHVFGADRMTETTWEWLSDQIASVVRKDRTLRLLEAKVHFHYHKEQLRGRPLVLVRLRLFTDRGLFAAEGDGFGDRHAFSIALDSIERQLLDAKQRDRPEERLGDLWSVYAPSDEGE